jgi:gliding motility-associated-like protein
LNPCEDDLILLTENSTAGEGVISQITLTDGQGLEWNAPLPDSLFLAPEGIRNFTLIVTNSYNCIDSITQSIEVFERPILSVASDTFCEDRISSLKAGLEHAKNNNYAFDWEVGSNQTTYAQQDSLLLSFGEAASVPISLKLHYPDGCAYFYDTTILIHPLPEAGFSITPSKVNIVNPLIQVWDESNGASEWLYDMGDGNLIKQASFPYEFGDSGLYRITQTVHSNWGCMDTTQSLFRVEFFNTRYMPEAFSPNGDGLNDRFAPIGRGIYSYSLKIYNRWGELIFDSEEGEKSWDGTYRGKPVPIGMYTYQTTILNHKKQKIHLHGSLTLIR